MHNTLSMPLEEALRMASRYPAEVLGVTERGTLAKGARADFAHFGDDLKVEQTFLAGASVWRA